MGEEHRKQSGPWWRVLVSTVCVVLAAAALVGALATRYIARNVLDTNRYLAIVGPLPENPQVSAALAQFSTEKIFDAAGTESAIKDFLPPKLGALAGPLDDTLRKKFTQTAQRFIQSDAFGAIWTTANKTMQKGLLRVAESRDGQGKLPAVGSLDLSRLPASLRERFGNSGTLGGQQDKLSTIQINLHQRAERLRTTVRATKAGAYALPYVAAALLAAAIAVAFNRRRALLAIGAAVLLLGAALLITSKIVSGDLLGQISNTTYRSAAQVVYEAFYSDLRQRIIIAMVLAGILIILAILAGPYEWAKRLRGALGLPKLRRTKPHGWALAIRTLTAKAEPWLDLAGLALIIVWMLALSALTPATLIVILSILLSFVSLVHIIARPSPAGIS